MSAVREEVSPSAGHDLDGVLATIAKARPPAARVAPEAAAAQPHIPLPRMERVKDVVRARFRLPGSDDTPPSNLHLLALTFWAAVLGLAGLIPAGRVAAAVFFGDGPAWYVPASIGVGLVGVALVTSALAAVHRTFAPFALLSIATLFLTANALLTYLAI